MFPNVRISFAVLVAQSFVFFGRGLVVWRHGKHEASVRGGKCFGARAEEDQDGAASKPVGAEAAWWQRR